MHLCNIVRLFQRRLFCKNSKYLNACSQEKKTFSAYFFFQSHNCVTVHDVISILWFQTVFALSLCQYISSVTAYFGFFKFTYEIKVLKLGLSTHYIWKYVSMYIGVSPTLVSRWREGYSFWSS